MAQINLISPTLNKKIKKTRFLDVTKIDFLGILRLVIFSSIPLLVVMLGLSVALFVFMLTKTAELDKLRNKETAFNIDPQQLVLLSQRKDMLLKKKELLSELSTQKFLWSSKLNQISDCLPAGVWLTEISFYRPAATTGNAAKDKKEDKVRLLVVKGSAIAPQIEKAVSFIGEYVNALKRDSGFSQDFYEIKLNAIYKASIGKSDVMNFELACFMRQGK